MLVPQFARQIERFFAVKPSGRPVSLPQRGQGEVSLHVCDHAPIVVLSRNPNELYDLDQAIRNAHGETTPPAAPQAKPEQTSETISAQNRLGAIIRSPLLFLANDYVPYSHRIHCT